MSAPEPRIYAYGIVRSRDGGDLDGAAPIHGVCGSVVRPLAFGGLAALVSELPADGNIAIDDTSHDPDRIKSMVLDHHRVLQVVIEGRTVLPLRFGAVFFDDDGVTTALVKHGQELSEALERVEGVREWGVKIFCDHDVLRPHLGQDSDAIRIAHQQIAAASAGRAFFLRRQLERLVEEEIRQAIARCIADSHRLLSAAARATATLNIQPPSIHRRAGEMVSNAAYLVTRDGEDRFFALIDGLRDTCRRSGFDLRADRALGTLQLRRSSIGSVTMSRRIRQERNTALADLLDRALNKGVVLRGEAIISLAGIDLMYVGLKVLVSSFETAQRIRGASDMALLDGRRS